jgi:hypothetical protein
MAFFIPKKERLFFAMHRMNQRPESHKGKRIILGKGKYISPFRSSFFRRVLPISLSLRWPGLGQTKFGNIHPLKDAAMLIPIAP